MHTKPLPQLAVATVAQQRHQLVVFFHDLMQHGLQEEINLLGIFE